MSDIIKVNKINDEIEKKLKQGGLNNKDIKRFRNRLYKIDCYYDDKCHFEKSMILECLKEMVEVK